MRNKKVQFKISLRDVMKGIDIINDDRFLLEKGEWVHTNVFEISGEDDIADIVEMLDEASVEYEIEYEIDND